MLPISRCSRGRVVRRFALVLACSLCASAATAQVAPTDLNEAWWAAIGPDGVQHVNIRCGADFFDPRQIVVKANVPLQLAVSTTANLPAYNFTLTLGPINIDAPVGATQRSFVLSPPLSGRFQAICRATGNPESPAARRSRTGFITVIP